jgi:DNA-binding Lrp family transcriptional regulator
MPSRETAPPTRDGVWTFLTNHTHVLLCLAEDQNLRLRDVAERVGITERATQSIVADLVAGGYLNRQRVGRRNTYEVNRDLPLRHPIESHHSVGELIRMLRRPGRNGDSLG